MKKTLLIMLLALVAFTPLFAKAEEEAPDEAAGPVELTLWHETEPAIADALTQVLSALEPEIKVNVVRKEKVTEALKLAAGDASSAPDLFWFAHDKVGLFATIGAIEPLEDFIDISLLDSFVPMTKEAGEFKGQHYLMPVYFETLLFMYNKDLMPEPPATTDELLALMKAETTEDYYVYAEQHSTAYYAAAWLHPFGSYIINGMAEPGLGLPETLEAFEYHSQFIPYQPLDGEWNTVTTLFTTGQAASTLNGPWLVPDVRKAGINLGFASLPVTPTGLPMMPYAGVQGVMAIESSPHKDAIKKVMELLSGKELGEILALSTGAAPAHLDAYQNPEISSNELINAVKNAGMSATPMPNIPEMDVMWTTTEGALVEVNKKGADAAEALAKAQADSLQKIEDMQ